MSTQLIQRANDILREHDLPDRHSYFQIEKFIIGKEVTAHAQLWQVVRELDSRIGTVEALQADIEDAEDQLELFEIEIETLNLQIRKLTDTSISEDMDWYAEESHKLKIRSHEINIRKMERKKNSLAKSARKVAHKMKSVMEEMNCLIAAYDKIKGVIGECKEFDDRESQREMWNEKFLEEFNLRALLQRPLDTDFVKSIMALDDDAPVKMHTTELLANIQGKMLANHHKQIQSQISKGSPQKAPSPAPKQKRQKPLKSPVFSAQRGPIKPRASIVKK
jgi:SMC interacting uncharacterized protein involved in chromosome segregation